MNDKEKSPYLIREKEPNLLDMLWKILYSWRLVLVCGVVFACLLSGFKYAKDYKNSTAVKNVSVENLRMGLTEDEIRDLDKAIIENASIESQLKFNTEYQKNSILMNIDPYNKNQIILQYYVDSGYTVDFNDKVKQDYTQGLLRSYATFISNGQITEECAQKLNEENSQYLAEVITTDADLQEKETVMFENTFCVSVTGKDMQQARVIADVVKSALESYQKELTSKIGAHELVLVSDHEQVVQDTALAEQQAKVETTNYNLRLQQDALISKLSAQQIQILNLEQKENDNSAETNTETLSAPKVSISIKYILLGFIVGAFLVCAVIALMYIFNAHLRNEKELQEFYGLRIFGILDQSPASKKLFSFVDKWFDRLSGKQKGVLKEQLQIAITNLAVTCKKNAVDKIFFTTAISLNETERELIKQITVQLQQEGIQCVFEANMMQNIKALVQMSEIGQVVLLEKEGRTKYQELEKELILCREQNAEVLGVFAVR